MVHSTHQRKIQWFVISIGKIRWIITLHYKCHLYFKWDMLNLMKMPLLFHIYFLLGYKYGRKSLYSYRETDSTAVLEGLTSPSVDLMLASCTTSRCAAWETIGSEDREMMWSHTSDSVLHWGGKKEHLEMYRLQTQCARYSLALVEENSPRVEFCFPFHTQSSPAGWQSVLNWLLLAFWL